MAGIYFYAAGAPSPYENFSGYTLEAPEGQGSGLVSFIDDNLTVDFDEMPRVNGLWVYKDFGIDYFGEFEINFQAEITAGQTEGLAVIAMTNLIGGGDFEDLQVPGGFCAGFDYSGSNLRIFVAELGVAAGPFVIVGTSLPLTNCIFKRVGTTLSLDVGGVYLSSLTVPTTKFRVFEPLTNRGAGPADPNWIDGQFKNFEIVSAG